MCKDWSKWNSMVPRNVRYWKRSKSWPMVKWTLEVCNWQAKRGKYFVLENPEGSAIRDTLLASKPFSVLGVRFGTLDQCMFGQCDRESGLLNKKPTVFVNNLYSDLISPVLKRCYQNHKHQILEGRNKFGSRTAQAQVYPRKLCQL